MLLNEKEFQNILAQSPRLIADILNLKAENMRISNIEFWYPAFNNYGQSRFDLIVSYYHSDNSIIDIFIELKTLDQSSSYEQIEKYYHIITSDPKEKLADHKRELHFIVLKSAYDFDKTEKYIENFNSRHAADVKLHYVSEHDFRPFIEKVGSKKYAVDYFLEYYGLSDIDLERVKDAFKTDEDKAYILNFINYLYPKYGALQSERYKSADNYFYYVFDLAIKYIPYSSIKPGKNNVHKPGNKRTINFKYNGTVVFELFANNYPLQLKINLGGKYEAHIHELYQILSKYWKKKVIVKGNIELLNGNNLFLKAYPSKKHLLIPLGRSYESNSEKCRDLIETLGGFMYLLLA